MSNILSSILTTSFAASIIRIMVPILFAALAASITEKAGVVNIGLEGTMSLCALIAVTCAWKSGSTFVGVLGAMVLGVLLSLMIGFFAFKFKTDIILCGIAVNTLGEGGAVLLLYLLTGSKGDTQTVMGAWNLPRVTIPVLSKIPVIGEIFFTNQSVLTYVAFLCVLLVWILLYKTPWASASGRWARTITPPTPWAWASIRSSTCPSSSAASSAAWPAPTCPCPT